MGREVFLTQCRKVTATGKVSGLCPERLPVGKVVTVPMQMHHIPSRVLSL